MKLYKMVSYLGAFSYVVLGLLTIGSILNGTRGFHINLIMGGFFITIGYYLYSKAKNIVKLVADIEDLCSKRQAPLSSSSRFLFFEKIFIAICLLFGLILLSAAISRVFGENLPIFG